MRLLKDNIVTLLLVIIAFLLGAVMVLLLTDIEGPAVQQDQPNPPQQQNALPSETLPPYTPFTISTPAITRTLKPPPTIETATPTPISPTPTYTPSATLTLTLTYTPSATLTPTLTLTPSLTLTPTPITPTATFTPRPTFTETPCAPREDWQARHTVQFNEILTRIAQQYNTTVEELSLGNCLENNNLIVEGQVLRVPGVVLGSGQVVQCSPLQPITPAHDAHDIAGAGIQMFTWEGFESPRYALRIIRPDGSQFEAVVEQRRSEAVDLAQNLPMAGHYVWYVYPLDTDFRQLCPEGGPWSFIKAAPPTNTPSPTPPPPFAAFMPSTNAGPAPLTVTFTNQSTGIITTYAWDFDNDGVADSNDQTTAHVFPVPGAYTVRLIVTGPGGTSTNTATIIVN